ncbi:MAG: hypothetical protein ACJAY8_001491, partial [Sphingobacteriales bacterium]
MISLNKLLFSFLLTPIIGVGFSQETPGAVCNQFLENLSGTPDKSRDWDWLSAHLSVD